MHTESTAIERLDFPASSVDKEEKSEKLEEKTTNFLFVFLLLITVVGSTVMSYVIADFRKELIEANASYNFPKLSDFLMVLKICPLIMVSKLERKLIEFFFILILAC